MTTRPPADGADDPADRDTTGDDAAPERAPAVTNDRRPSKWDRPPAPRDWRFVVGWVGKVMIAAGLLLFGFVAYQLWGTGIATARAQNQLEREFAAAVAERTPPPTTTVAATAPPTSEPGSTDGTLPITDPTTSTPRQELPPIERGGPLAKLEIPRIGLTSIVVPGVALDDLEDGPGHYPDTPLPGQLGNAAIAGHRTTHGAPFFDVDQLQPGDEIIVTMISGDRFVYRVTGTEIVAPSDYWVVATTDPTVAELTLTSCHPKYEARQRIVVHALLDEDRSDPVGTPTYYDLDGGDTALPGDDTVATGEEPTASSPSATTAAEPTDDGEATAGAELTTEPPVVDEDATLTAGWFDDRGAFPQIALWGSLLILIAVAAHRLSRRVRHDSVGFLAGIAPFVVVLYFFYENVARLLPPGL